MVAAFNSATGSKEARESLSEANKGYKECTEVCDRPEVSVFECFSMYTRLSGLDFTSVENRYQTVYCKCSNKSLLHYSHPSLHLSLQHMCSLESELESQMGEFHVKMKGESFFFLPLPISSDLH